jgi:hypothetical protein
MMQLTLTPSDSCFVSNWSAFTDTDQPANCKPSLYDADFELQLAEEAQHAARLSPRQFWIYFDSLYLHCPLCLPWMTKHQWASLTKKDGTFQTSSTLFGLFWTS